MYLLNVPIQNINRETLLLTKWIQLNIQLHNKISNLNRIKLYTKEVFIHIHLRVKGKKRL